MSLADATWTAALTAAEGLFLMASVGTLCRRAAAIGQRLGLLDYPDAARKFHAAPTPLVGGLSIMLPLLAVALVEAWRHPELSRIFLLTGAAVGAFLLLGGCDDRKQISASVRLLVSTLILTAALALEPALVLTRLSFAADSAFIVPLGPFGGAFTLLCLLGFLNAVNMADGANGLVIGLAIGWLLLLLPYAPAELQGFVLLALAALAAALPFNLRGQMFLGDSGAYAVSVLVGLLVILVYNRSAGLLAATVMLWLMLPVVDCLRVMLRRMREGRSPFAPDRLHLHHRLMDRLDWPAATAAYLGLALLPGAAAALLPDAAMLLAFSALVVYWLTLRACRAG